MKYGVIAACILVFVFLVATQNRKRRAQNIGDSSGDGGTFYFDGDSSVDADCVGTDAGGDCGGGDGGGGGD